jgi:hypothetical protein
MVAHPPASADLTCDLLAVMHKQQAEPAMAEKYCATCQETYPKYWVQFIKDL